MRLYKTGLPFSLYVLNLRSSIRFDKVEETIIRFQVSGELYFFEECEAVSGVKDGTGRTTEGMEPIRLFHVQYITEFS